MNTPTVRALTAEQPWASCIAYATKRVINQHEPTDYRGLLLLHAGHRIDHHAWSLPLTRPLLRRPLTTSAVIAVARLDDCHADDGFCTLWSARDRWHWRLTDIVALAKPVPWPGGTGALWAPPAPLLTNPRIAEALEVARA